MDYLFPDIFDFLKEKGVLVITVAPNLLDYSLTMGRGEKDISENWRKKRINFYRLSTSENPLDIDPQKILVAYKEKALKKI